MCTHTGTVEVKEVTVRQQESLRPSTKRAGRMPVEISERSGLLALRTVSAMKSNKLRGVRKHNSTHGTTHTAFI